MTETPPPEPSAVQHPLFDSRVPQLATILFGNVFSITAVALLKPGIAPSLWSVPLILFAALGALLPVALGVALMLIRRDRYALPLGTFAAGLTTVFVVGDILAVTTPLGWTLVVAAVGVAQVVFCFAGRLVTERNMFPPHVRLAAFALVFKLAIVGLLASAFVPAERNPLGVMVGPAEVEIENENATKIDEM